jgi:hypothetical protein
MGFLKVSHIKEVVTRLVKARIRVGDFVVLT